MLTKHFEYDILYKHYFVLNGDNRFAADSGWKNGRKALSWY